MLAIFERARKFMSDNGNPNQWKNYPPVDLIRSDIKSGKSYVCVEGGAVVGTFFYDFGAEIEPTYRVIDGAWKNDGAYGVIHRIASSGAVKGFGEFCLNWAFARGGHLRIDTHADNKILQHLLKKLGFEYCGVVYIRNNEPRLAYEKF